MSGDELALLAAIRKKPRDDTPRLVYADWLEEHGQPERAAFIRGQCRGEGVSLDEPTFRKWFAPWWGPDLPTNIRHERDTVVVTLNGPDPADRPPDEQGAIIVRRGFAERIELTCEAFLRIAADGSAVYYPAVTEVWLIDRNPDYLDDLHDPDLDSEEYRGENDFPHYWVREDEADQAAVHAGVLPAVLYDQLRGGRRLIRGDEGEQSQITLFPGRYGAMRSLSAACSGLLRGHTKTASAGDQRRASRAGSPRGLRRNTE